MENNNGLNGHPCLTDLVNDIALVTPPFNMTCDPAPNPNINESQDILVPKPISDISWARNDQLT